MQRQPLVLINLSFGILLLAGAGARALPLNQDLKGEVVNEKDERVNGAVCTLAGKGLPGPGLTATTKGGEGVGGKRGQEPFCELPRFRVVLSKVNCLTAFEGKRAPDPFSPPSALPRSRQEPFLGQAGAGRTQPCVLENDQGSGGSK